MPQNSPSRFWSVVYNRAIVYKRQNFLKVVVHVITIEQCNQTALFLSLLRQSAVDRKLSAKPGLGHPEHWQTVQTEIRRRRTRRLIRVCTVCLNYRKLRVK